MKNFVDLFKNIKLEQWISILFAVLVLSLIYKEQKLEKIYEQRIEYLLLQKEKLNQQLIDCLKNNN